MERKFIDLRITTLCNEDLIDFLTAVRKIQHCGDVGINRLIPIRVDGDGSGHINVEIHTKKITDSELKNIRDVINLNKNEIQKVNDGDDFETHYIGE